MDVMMEARLTASALFHEIGVELEWEKGDPDCVEVGIVFEQATPVDSHPDALAYAMPFRGSGARVHVLLSHIAAVSSPGRRGLHLGYVLAHEIGHVLERMTRHSAEGVMKACWDKHDLALMAGRKLRFAAEDAEWIHLRFVRRLV
jgi:hypothetical protein